MLQSRWYDIEKSEMLLVSGLTNDSAVAANNSHTVSTHKHTFTISNHVWFPFPAHDGANFWGPAQEYELIVIIMTLLLMICLND